MDDDPEFTDLLLDSPHSSEFETAEESEEEGENNSDGSDAHAEASDDPPRLQPLVPLTLEQETSELIRKHWRGLPAPKYTILCLIGLLMFLREPLTLSATEDLTAVCMTTYQVRSIFGDAYDSQSHQPHLVKFSPTFLTTFSQELVQRALLLRNYCGGPADGMHHRPLYACSSLLQV